MRKVFILFYLSLLFSFCNAQSNSELKNKLSGTKYAFLNLNKAQESILLNNSISKDAEVLRGIIRYLKQLELEVILSSNKRHEAFKTTKTHCDFVKFSYTIGNYETLMMKDGFYPFTFSFTFCDNSTYSFNTKLSVAQYTEYAFESWANCIDKFFFDRKYNELKRLKNTVNEKVISKPDLSNYLDTSKNKKPIEGIYKLFVSDTDIPKYTIGIHSQNDTLKIVYFDGAGLSEDWKEGDLMGYLFNTLSENDYTSKWFDWDKSIIDGIITFTNKNAFDFRSTSLGYSNSIDKFIRTK
jgi:hypothetical protein